MSVMDLYLKNDVWRRLPDGVCVRYAILTHKGSGLHAVQSADFFSDDDPESFSKFFRQYIQLFREQSPLDRCDWFDTIEGAIAAHDQDFSEFNAGASG